MSKSASLNSMKAAPKASVPNSSAQANHGQKHPAAKPTKTFSAVTGPK